MLRTEEARNRRSQARTVYKHLKGTHDKGRIAEEPGEGKLSSPVLEQRWAGRLTHRLSQIERGDFTIAAHPQECCNRAPPCSHWEKGRQGESDTAQDFTWTSSYGPE